MNTNKLIFIMMTKPDSNTGACGGEVVSFSTKKKNQHASIQAMLLEPPGPRFQPPSSQSSCFPH